MASPREPLKFQPLQSAVDAGFFMELANNKLDSYKLSELPVPLEGFFTASTHVQVPSPLQVEAQALAMRGGLARGQCGASGLLHNVNTIEKFKTADRPALVKAVTEEIWADLCSGEAERDPARLNRFVVLSFADLKKFSFFYWFAFPALQPPTPVTAGPPMTLAAAVGDELAGSVLAACEAARSGAPAGEAGGTPPAWLVHLPTSGGAAAYPLVEWAALQQAGGQVMLAAVDPCNLSGNPGWPIRSLLVLAAVRWGCRGLKVLGVREQAGRASAERCLVFDVDIPEVSARGGGEGGGGGGAPPPLGAPGGVAAASGWEANARGKMGPRALNLGPTMDPRRLAESAVNLNLKLMRWRALPELDTAALGDFRCLLLGAGTLGCAVARTLLGWGVRKFTLCDSGNVSFSNPVRQSLFEFEDCLGGGRPKAEAAAERLAKVFPGVEARGVQLSIPMPGHPVSDGERARVLADVTTLEGLFREHDAVFLLTDTRESRWLPSLLAADTGLLALNAALGFDGYLVMRHGGAAIGADGEDVVGGGGEGGRLGCYFCNDVVAPLDSTTDRTLDQQCTVTRPGLAPVAAALASELAVALLQHPRRGAAPASGEGGPLGACPHMVRGSVRDFSQVVLLGESFKQCTACSPAVVREYRQRGHEFLLEAFASPAYLEDLTGLTQLHADVAVVDWDVDSAGEEGGGDDSEWTEL